MSWIEWRWSTSLELIALEHRNIGSMTTERQTRIRNMENEFNSVMKTQLMYFVSKHLQLSFRHFHLFGIEQLLVDQQAKMNEISLENSHLLPKFYPLHPNWFASNLMLNCKVGKTLFVQRDYQKFIILCPNEHSRFVCFVKIGTSRRSPSSFSSYVFHSKWESALETVQFSSFLDFSWILKEKKKNSLVSVIVVVVFSSVAISLLRCLFLVW